MNQIPKFPFFLFLSLAAVLLVTIFFRTDPLILLNPVGKIGIAQKDLMIMATWLMLIVVIPVFVLIFIFAWKYRADNAKAKYDPSWDKNVAVESLWWGLPLIIVIALSIITWQKTHELDPYLPIESEKEAIEIQVIALQWQWLFIYPKENIATLNTLHFPEKTPIHFQITSDAPMNSFWIPQLGGQIYAMPGGKTNLHLIADKTGEFRGRSANLSGVGFAGMTFTAISQTESDFENWVHSVKKSSSPLTLEVYNEVAKPTENGSVATYNLERKDLFERVVMKYMMPE